MINWKSDGEILLTQDTAIRDCKAYRKEWETIAMEVELSYRGIKFPVHNKLGEHKNDPKYPVYVNIVKRQHRAIANYLLNNEPGISVRRAQDISHEDVEKTSILLKRDFVDSDFYDNDMDDIIEYWMRRWIVYIISYLNNGKIKDKVMDSMDCYVDITARRKNDIRYIIDTFTKSIEECKSLYTTDANGQSIDWDSEATAIKKAESEEKNTIIKEPSIKNVIMFREGWYLDEDKSEDKKCVVKVLTTKTRVIKKETYYIDFLPLSWFDPVNNRDSLYNDSWFKWVIEPERVVNRILAKFVHIVDTWGRYLYVREWTKVTKWKNKLLESLGIEIIEIWAAQEIPRPAELLTITNSQINLLERMVRQAEEEWGMRQDAMGESSLWRDASGRAIEALQAGSKGNIWPAVMQLNKFMNRLAHIHLNLYKQVGGQIIKLYEWKSGQEIEIDPKKLWVPVLHIEPRSAFDDIVRKQDALSMLEFVFKFKPDTQLTANTIAEIFGLKNDLAEKMMFDIKQAENPDIKHAEASISLLLAGRTPAVSKDDNHEIHMAMLTKVMSDAWEKMPEQIQKNFIDKFRKHEAHAWWTPRWNQD